MGENLQPQPVCLGHKPVKMAGFVIGRAAGGRIFGVWLHQQAGKAFNYAIDKKFNTAPSQQVIRIIMLERESFLRDGFQRGFWLDAVRDINPAGQLAQVCHGGIAGGLRGIPIHVMDTGDAH